MNIQKKCHFPRHFLIFFFLIKKKMECTYTRINAMETNVWNTYPVESLSLENVAIHPIKLPPSACASSVDTPF